MNHNRTTALALLLLIIAAHLALSGGAVYLWQALWGGPYPLGKALTANIGDKSNLPASGGGGSSGGF